jgi:hypothetical protein
MVFAGGRVVVALDVTTGYGRVGIARARAYRGAVRAYRASDRTTDAVLSALQAGGLLPHSRERSLVPSRAHHDLQGFPVGLTAS